MDEKQNKSDLFRPDTWYTRRWRQYAAVIISTLTMFSSGAHYSWTSPTLPKLYANDSLIPTTVYEGSWLASISTLGDLVGAPIGAFIADYLGRKEAVFFTTTPYLIAWVMIYFARSMPVLMAARFIVGISDGSTFTILPMYIGEIADNDIRGRLGNCIMVMCDFGTLFMYTLGPYISIPSMAAVSSIAPILVYVLFPFFPESPYYYLMKDDYDKAKNSLQKLRGRDNVDDEVNDLQKVVARQSEQSTSWRELFATRSNFKALLILLGLKTAQQFSGIGAMIVFAEPIFTDAGGYFSSAISAMIVGSVLFSFSFISAVVVDILGRKPLLIISCIGCSLSCLMTGVYFYLKQATEFDVDTLNMVPIISLVGYIIMYSCGLGAIPYMMPSELFPTNIKAKALCLMDVYLALAAFTVTITYHPIAIAYGSYVPFFMYALSSCVSAICIKMYVPETKGRSLEEIQEMLKGGRKR